MPVLKSERHFKGASPEAARLWKWHAIEEIEHKGVAFDTFLAATEKLSAYQRWKFRSLVMLHISYTFLRGRVTRDASVPQAGWYRWTPSRGCASFRIC